jgi:hypothetical protein
MTVVEERDYLCTTSGKWRFATNVELGTTGNIRTKCAERECGRQQSLNVGERPRPNRQLWIASVRARREQRRAS